MDRDGGGGAGVGGGEVGAMMGGQPPIGDDPSGARWLASYTPEGFVDRVDVTVPGSPNAFAQYAGYDALGNPGSVTTSEGATSLLYDARSRVTQVDYPDGTAESFQYDAVGHRTLHVDPTGTSRTYVVDAAQQLREIRATATDTLLASFAYDGAGRRTQRTPADGSPSTTYAYDGLGALTGVTRSDGTTAALGYGPLRRRILRDEGGASALYPDAAVELGGAAAFRVLQGPGPLRLAEVEATAGGHRVHQLYPDGSRNLARVATTDEAGATALEPPRRLEAFGAVRSGSSVTEHAFAGQPFEGATGLVYMNARHYDPATGTFLQTDPLGIEAGELYAYARGNPYRFWDPSGLVPQSLDLAGEALAFEGQSGSGDGATEDWLYRAGHAASGASHLGSTTRHSKMVDRPRTAAGRTGAFFVGGLRGSAIVGLGRESEIGLGVGFWDSSSISSFDLVVFRTEAVGAGFDLSLDNFFGFSRDPGGTAMGVSADPSGVAFDLEVDAMSGELNSFTIGAGFPPIPGVAVTHSRGEILFSIRRILDF